MAVAAQGGGGEVGVNEESRKSRRTRAALAWVRGGEARVEEETLGVAGMGWGRRPAEHSWICDDCVGEKPW